MTATQIKTLDRIRLQKGRHFAHYELAKITGVSVEVWEAICVLYNNFDKKPLSLVQLSMELEKEMSAFIQNWYPRKYEQICVAMGWKQP